MQIGRAEELALTEARQCVRNCERYSVAPAPYFTLLLRMYEEMEGLGLICRKEESQPEDFCAGCPECKDGSCRNGYRGAELSLDGRQVRGCRYRVVAEARAGG